MEWNHEAQPLQYREHLGLEVSININEKYTTHSITRHAALSRILFTTVSFARISFNAAFLMSGLLYHVLLEKPTLIFLKVLSKVGTLLVSKAMFELGILGL